jgi:hypothetical protein
VQKGELKRNITWAYYEKIRVRFVDFSKIVVIRQVPCRRLGVDIELPMFLGDGAVCDSVKFADVTG